MFVRIANTPRDYAWGSKTAIAGLLGSAPSGRAEAELWLGTHPGSPSILVSPSSDGPQTLDQLTELPFLLKVLAAEAPLSLQAHPTIEQARAGFAAENAAGIPLDAVNRNYKDALHKPELIYALSDEFHALCGFRPVAATRALLLGVPEFAGDPLVISFLDRLADDSSLPAVFEWLISRGEGAPQLIARVVELSASVAAAESWRTEGEFAPGLSSPALELATVGVLAAAYPGDPGIVISLLLNRVVLAKGDVLYLPAGNIHAYLSGLGIELMAASDNVLRGGLTPKYVDVPELLAILDFAPLPAPLLTPLKPSPHITLFQPPAAEFALVVVSEHNDDDVSKYSPGGTSIALCVDGAIHIHGAHGDLQLSRGEAAFISGDEDELRFTGAGTVFLAVPGRR